MFIPADVFELHTDASGMGIGGVLNIVCVGESLFSPAQRSVTKILGYRIGNPRSSGDSQTLQSFLI